MSTLKPSQKTHRRCSKKLLFLPAEIQKAAGMSYNQLVSALQQPDYGKGKEKNMPRFWAYHVYSSHDPIKLIVCHKSGIYEFGKEQLLDRDKASDMHDNSDKHPTNNRKLTKIWSLYGFRPTSEPLESIQNFVDSLHL